MGILWLPSSRPLARVQAGWVIGGATAGTTAQLRPNAIPLYSVRRAANGGVILDVATNAGNPSPLKYIFVEVMNLSVNNPSLLNLTCDVWPRVQ